MTMDEFCRVVDRVLATLPPEIKDYLHNVVVDVEEEPSVELLRELGYTEEEIEADEMPYGLFSPMPIARPDDVAFFDEPHRIYIWKRPLEEDFPDRKELLLEIRKTVIHEVAHQLGFNERDLDRFESVKDPFGDDFDYGEGSPGAADLREADSAREE
jgi:predicted Zn-dependent protease with MMP-like domain